MAARYVGNEKGGFVEIGVPHSYKIGDVVFWATASGAGEYTFIGHPKSDKAGKVLVLALGAEIGFGVDAHVRPDGPQQPAARPRVSPEIFPQPSAGAGG